MESTVVWTHQYTPLGGSLAWSAALAALPVLTLVVLLAGLRRPSWQAAIGGLLTAAAVAIWVYGMPAGLVVGAVGYGAAFGLFPIGWTIFWAVALYRLSVETGQFEVIKNSIGRLTPDRRLQALLIAFAFGAFIEGASGFGTPVAVASAMLTGLGFPPFYAAAICLLANTAPVAFGAIGTPLVTLAGVTGLPLASLSAEVGRICAPVSVFIPAYLMLVMGGVSALRAVFPAAAVCGVFFAATQWFVSRYIGPNLTDILASLAATVGLLALLRVWRPRDGLAISPAPHLGVSFGTLLRGWAPYIFLVVLVLLWGMEPVKAVLNKATVIIAWPHLDGLIGRVPPAVPKAGPYAAKYSLALLSASGTSALLAMVLTALMEGVSPRRFVLSVAGTARDLALPVLTTVAMLALAFLMNYSGATGTLGLAFASSGVLFPFFSALVGWLGVFLTGSDSSSNALFGNLQVVTAHRLGLSPELMAASSSSGGVMGKMISLQSIAVAAAATGLPAEDEARLFRFTLKHSIFLACVIGLLVTLYAYVLG